MATYHQNSMRCPSHRPGRHPQHRIQLTAAYVIFSGMRHGFDTGSTLSFCGVDLNVYLELRRADMVQAHIRDRCSWQD